MTKSTEKKLSWKPIRRGNVFCSSACGHGCKLKEYQAAIKRGRDIASTLKTNGWTYRVHENIGWHLMWTNKLCGMSLYYHNGRYHCMMQSGESTCANSGCSNIAMSDYHTDPNEAIEQQFKLAKRWFKAQVKGLFNLRSIKSK